MVAPPILIFSNLGFGYDKLVETDSSRKVFVFLYCLANFFQNFGPNTTTFVIPGEIFPTRYRSTAHGISAASGKLGAIVAQVSFSYLKNIGGENKFVKHMYVIPFYDPRIGIDKPQSGNVCPLHAHWYRFDTLAS